MPPHIDVINHYQPLTFNQNNFNQFRIRFMSESDIDIVQNIDAITWNESSWPSESFLNALYNPLWTCWIIESTNHDRSILGYGFQYLKNNKSHIANFCIHPNQRGRGLGGILLRYMINYSHRYLGVSIIDLEVNTTNTNAYNLYSKHGFRIHHILKGYYSESEDAYRMQLVIKDRIG